MTAISIPLAQGETYRRLSEQAKRLPNRPNASTCWRWHRVGVFGIKLEVLRVGGVTMCSDEALDRFLAAINEPRQSRQSSAPVKTPRSAKQRRESVRRAEQILSAAGI